MFLEFLNQICNLCKENNVELVFYSMPGSDFYLHEKGNYDNFYFEIKDFLNSLGYDYYDFTDKITREDMFYTSYTQKVAAQPDTIYGLIYHFSDDKKMLSIEPVKNHVGSSRITYDVYAMCVGEEITLAEKSNNTTFALPGGKSGKIRVISYIDGVKQNDCTENFAAF